MDKLLLFTDGSVDPKLKIGYGAYLAIDENDLSTDSKSTQVKVKSFDDTSSTKLELQTFIWALTEIQGSGRKVVAYTDSQNIIGLPSRRKSLEQNDFYSSKSKRLKNHELYREFYKIMDHLDCELIKVAGHLSLVNKDAIDRLFTLVDRGSRKALKGAK
jgi:ribonuclease HI